MSLQKSQQHLKVGDIVPSFSLQGTDEQMHNLGDFNMPVLVVFMCNHCPFVIPKISRLNDIAKRYEGKIHVIGINSNNHPDYPADSFEKMKKLGVTFLYLFDATQEVAKAYGAMCTPDPFLIDENKKLFYHGRIDNALSPQDTPTAYEMEDMIDALLLGKAPSEDFRPSHGCSIKWQD